MSYLADAGLKKPIQIRHIGLKEEAELAQYLLKKVYNLDSKIKAVDAERKDKYFERMEIDGKKKFHPKLYANTLFITNEDLFCQNAQTGEDWAFGFTSKKNDACVSVARLKGNDGRLHKKLFIEKSVYLKRVGLAVLHEFGHTQIELSQRGIIPFHYRPAYYVNIEKDYFIKIGYHCTGRDCIMQQVIDIETPDPEKECLILGEEDRFDAGLNEAIERISPDYICKKCEYWMNGNEKLDEIAELAITARKQKPPEKDLTEKIKKIRKVIVEEMDSL